MFDICTTDKVNFVCQALHFTYMQEIIQNVSVFFQGLST